VTQFSARRAGRHRLRVAVAIFLGGTILLALSWNTWLPWIGEWLVSPDTPAPADLIVVLGGDFWGPRAVKGAELGVHGYAPHVLISGPEYVWYGKPYPEGDLATMFLVQKGYPRSLFETFFHHASSTIGEAKALAPELKRRNVRRVLIVTSSYHSRRASLVFHAVLPFTQIRVIGVPDYQLESWWKIPISRRLVRSEWSKIMGTIAIGWILRLQALTA
jgi:uncharacterized SAM-binding protein YcdF (DUF218 family)